MTRDEVLTLITPMAAAWPYPEWDDARIELWVAAMADIDCTPAVMDVVANAVRRQEEVPTVAWMRTAITAEYRKDDMGGPRALEAPVSQDWRAGLAAARAAFPSDRAEDVAQGAPTPSEPASAQPPTEPVAAALRGTSEEER